MRVTDPKRWFTVLAVCLFGACLVHSFFIYGKLKPAQIVKNHSLNRAWRHRGNEAYDVFTGVSECNMPLASMYTVPLPLDGSTPFCSSRLQLLSALSSGGRYGYDAPYVGRGCQLQWYPSQEICMIISRMNNIVFIGDEIARNIYMAFNILLQEDFALGALEKWRMEEIDKEICSCGAQFSDLNGVGCSRFAIKSTAEISFQESKYLCSSPSHSYISGSTDLEDDLSKTEFARLMVGRPNPWQPSPVIVSSAGNLDKAKTATILQNLQSLIDQAQRNIPVLVLGPIRDDHRSTFDIQDFGRDLMILLDRYHYEYLGLWNMTLQSNMDISYAETERMAVVQAMMIVNWLSKLPTS